MFDQVNGLPLHPLAIHAAVVLVPLAGPLAVLFVIPRTRRWARVAMPLVAVGAFVSVWVSVQTGESLEENLESRGLLVDGSPQKALVETHSERAETLLVMMAVFAAVAVLAALLARNAERFHGALAIVVSVVLLVAAGAVAFQTYRVGDAGAKAVWNPDGTQDYSGG